MVKTLAESRPRRPEGDQEDVWRSSFFGTLFQEACALHGGGLSPPKPPVCQVTASCKHRLAGSQTSYRRQPVHQNLATTSHKGKSDTLECPQKGRKQDGPSVQVTWEAFEIPEGSKRKTHRKACISTEGVTIATWAAIETDNNTWHCLGTSLFHL